MSPPYLPIYGITLPFQVNLHVPSLKFQMNICFVCLDRSWSDRGRSVSSMLRGLFSWWVFIHSSLHERGGNRDSQSRNKKLEIIKQNSPRNVVGLDGTCRGFVTADVRRLRFEAIAKAVDSKGLVEMRDTSLPRFGPSGRGKSLRPACVVLDGVSITRERNRLT